MKASLFASPVMDRNPDQDMLWRMFGVFYYYIKVIIVIKHAGVYEFKFRVFFGSAAIFFKELFIRKRSAGIFIQHFHVGVGRRIIQVIVEFLHILAMISFRVGQSKIALLQNGIFFIPQR